VAPGGLRTLGEDQLEPIAKLCSRSLSDPPAPDELARALFVADQPVTVLGDPAVGVVATCLGRRDVGTEGQGFVRLLVVAPEHRGRGHGRTPLTAAEDDLRARGARSVGTGADAPYYLWPGAEAREVALLCLLERAKYARTNANFNMDVDLTRIPDDPGGWSVATAAEREEVRGWAAREWPNWEAEMLRAADRGTLVLGRDAEGIAAACAYDVNRAGWVGPVAVRRDRLGRGAGVAPLLGALHRMRAAGRTTAEVGWVGPVVPYARVGATIGRVFFTHRKELV
jgi:GNAT superfamily N-acetyltransferase